MEFLPISKPFFSADAVTCLEYTPWFRVFDKSYLLLVEVWSRYIFRGTDIPHILCPYADFDYVAYVESDAAAYTLNDNDTNPVVNVSFDARVNVNVYGFWDTIHLHINSVSNIHRIIVLSRWVIGATIF
ncbi:hypothetical protein J1N35_000946 [Gossypium stocksii]|uniref:Uncharacterized protein n=1 Tax=Gossypium stocksii TaxID=47602 RepID=A0A9D3WJK1_9ROSI|nr:hypothetical protein J1N35_000946 [Gossypium stocksii]